MSTRHLGILGHSWEGASACFRSFCSLGFQHLGEFRHPEVTLDCIAFGECMSAYDRGDLATVRDVLDRSLRRLAAAGADFFVCADNTAHSALELDLDPLALPGLHLPRLVAEHAEARGYSRVGVLGTSFTMHSTLYPDALGERGIGCLTPAEDDRDAVDAIIFGELVHGVYRPESRRRYLEVIERLRRRGCDSVALACTEVPLLLGGHETALPVLDSTALLSQAAFDVCTGRRPMPGWRGGSPRE